jgi:hypothetical protein
MSKKAKSYSCDNCKNKYKIDGIAGEQQLFSMEEPVLNLIDLWFPALVASQDTKTVAFLLSPAEYLFLNSTIYLENIRGYFHTYSLLFIPFPRCFNRIDLADAQYTSTSIQKSCAFSYTSKVLTQVKPDLLIVTKETNRNRMGRKFYWL